MTTYTMTLRDWLPGGNVYVFTWNSHVYVITHGYMTDYLHDDV